MWRILKYLVYLIVLAAIAAAIFVAVQTLLRDPPAPVEERTIDVPLPDRS